MKIQRNKALYASIIAVAFTSYSQAAVSVINTYQTLDGVTKTGYTNPAAVDSAGPNPTTVNDGTPGTARFGYAASVTFTNGNFASWNTNISPGGWSFADIRNDHYFTGNNGNTGWGHASRWYLLEITEATDFRIDMTSAIADARPGFVIYTGESLQHTFGEAHQYSNNGVEMFRNDGWDQNTPKLGYLTNGFNASGNSLSQTMNLQPGLYTLVFGNIGSSTMTTGAKTYSLTMTVPEPSATMLSMAGVLGLFLRRRRL